MTERSLLAVIPARGGSKGLAGKNVRPLAGLPLIAHTIRCAQMCSVIDRCIISTDSEEIAEVARAHGGEVPFMRSPELARDDTPMWPVIRDALQRIEQEEGRRYGSVLLLDPTSPGRMPEDIAAAVQRLSEKPDMDGVVGVSRPDFQPLWHCVVEREGQMTDLFDVSLGYNRRQDVPTVYRINASLYLWRSTFVHEEVESWRNGRLLIHEVPERRSIHIDELDDFNKADILIRAGYIEFPWLRDHTAQ